VWANWCLGALHDDDDDVQEMTLAGQIVGRHNWSIGSDTVCMRDVFTQ
jgi:hypothetical protein